MVEVTRDEIPSKGAVGAALGTGIAGLALGVLNGGIPNVLGGWGGYNGNNWGAGVCHENMPINRYEAAQSARIAELETEVKLRDANTYTLGEMNKMRDYVDRKFDKIDCAINQQAVYNATNTAALNCMNGQIAQLMGLTKLVVPNGSICPGWGDVTVSITPAPTTGA